MTNPLSRDEDFFIEVKEPKSGSYTQTEEDIEYVRQSLYRALKIPVEFLNKPKP